MSEVDVETHSSPALRHLDIDRRGFLNCGFHLTRVKWDPYPWVSEVDTESPAEVAGIQPGDCVLGVNGEDIVGLRISEVAELVKSCDKVSLMLWNAGVDSRCSPEALCCGPMPKNLQRLSACMSTILAILECPVCLDTILPPSYQCDNGHLICIRCHAKTQKCPICRIRLSRGRSLLADQEHLAHIRRRRFEKSSVALHMLENPHQIYGTITETFGLQDESEELKKTKVRQMFKLRSKNKNIPDIKITNAHTNKILSKLIGKASSVDNLNTSVKRMPKRELSVQDTRFKSLSANDIFRKSTTNISTDIEVMTECLQPEEKIRKVNLLCSRPSFHGSLEVLEPKNSHNYTLYNSYNPIPTDDVLEDGILYTCPFTSECSRLIKGLDIFQHFQESHDGPLVQYFKPNIALPLLNTDKSSTYVINNDGNTYFLKIERNMPLLDDGKSDTSIEYHDTLIWIWLCASEKQCNAHQLRINICDSELKNKIFLSATDAVHSLNSTPYEVIKNSRKGVFLSAYTLKAIECFNPNIVLLIEIINCN